MSDKTKILLVDDDPSIVHLFKSFLEKSGYAVVTGADGLDALVLVEKERPDLIILDVMMPEVNGYDVCLKLKFDVNYKDIPIILLTARDRELNFHVGKKAGIEYIHKPVGREVILETIQRMLNT